VSYLPAESDTGMFGGNSNWRGPIWMPVNALLIRALLSFYLYYGDSFKVECPPGSGQMMNLFQVAEEIARRLTSIFLRDESGRRPVFGVQTSFRRTPTGAITFFSTNIFTVITAQVSEQAIRRGGAGWLDPSYEYSAFLMPAVSWKPGCEEHIAALVAKRLRIRHRTATGLPE
jgi:hypothetical protein